MAGQNFNRNDIHQDGFEFEEDNTNDDAQAAHGSALPVDDSGKAAAQDALIETQDLSSLEQLYNARQDYHTTQFGYDIFRQNDQYIDSAPMGAVQDNYVLGIGDEIVVSFSGQRNTRETVKVDQQGQIVIRDFPPVTAVGLKFSQLRSALEAKTQDLHNTQVYVAIGAVRRIGVLVMGNVERPGRRSLTVFHTVLDALMQSGGVRKDGSLRHIKLIRNDQAQVVDLYDVLMSSSIASKSDFSLRDGDRIVVPPIGPTVAVAGAVKRPGIFELASDSFRGIMGKSKDKITLAQILEMGGGVLSAGQNRFLLLTPSDDGFDVAKDVNEQSGAVFGDGAILLVERGAEKKAAQVTLMGRTLKAGTYDLGRHKTLSSVLIGQQVLAEDVYPLMGIIVRWDPERLATQFLSFPLRSVLQKQSDIDLRDGDRVLFFSNMDIQRLLSSGHNDDAHTEQNEFWMGILGLSSYVSEQSVNIRGAVRQEGQYPVADGVVLSDLVAAAGGLSRDADAQRVEITSLESEDSKNKNISGRQIVSLDEAGKNFRLRGGDAVRVGQKIREIEKNGVLIVGQVLRPGRYDLLPDDKVSDLIDRAGGLTQQAYPIGAVFSRESERKAEEARYKSAKQDLEKSLAAAVQKEKNAPDATQIQMVRDLADQLGAARALGRITIEADPDILSAKPELDMLLEEGDKLFIPKRPLTVRVSGEVLSPASLQFKTGQSPRDYIDQAGGFTYHADKDRAFVLYPDGSAQPLQVSVWNHKSIKIPPGSTIVVPRDPKPFDFIESARDFTQILSNLAVTAILVDDLQE